MINTRGKVKEECHKNENKIKFTLLCFISSILDDDDLYCYSTLLERGLGKLLSYEDV